MRYRLITLSLLCVVLVLSVSHASLAQSNTKQTSEVSTLQRLEIMRSKLESLRRSLNSAISSMPAPEKDSKEKAAADSPREILKGLDKEVASVLSEVNDIRGKQERAERFDPTEIDRLETSVTDVDTRVQAALQSTASARTVSPAASPTPKKKQR